MSSVLRRTLMASRILFQVLLLLRLALIGQGQSFQPSKTVQEVVRVRGAKIVLEHVRIIDGTGVPALEDQNLVIEGGKIASIQEGESVVPAESTTLLDLRGYTVIPGIVGMHNHLFYIARPNLDSRPHFDDPIVVPQMTFTAPRLYLAGGVTTMRTTGSVETYADLNLKHDIDSGKLPGPHLDVTGPYLEGRESYFLQMSHLTGPDDARQTVEYWADRGVTSFKAYMNITRAELKAAIDAAHKRGIKVTGHLFLGNLQRSRRTRNRRSRARIFRQHAARSRKETGHLQRELWFLHPRAHDSRQRGGQGSHRNARETSRRRHINLAGV